jgi:hypothetical protein
MPELSIFDDPRVAGAIVRLLRGRPLAADLEDLGRLLDESPGDLLALCQQNLVVLRTLEALEAEGVSLGDEAVAWQGQERSRIEQGLATIEGIAQQFARHEVPFMVIKTGDHFPDQGHDIDLLLADNGDTAERIMREDPRSCRQRATGDVARPPSRCTSAAWARWASIGGWPRRSLVTAGRLE